MFSDPVHALNGASNGSFSPKGITIPADLSSDLTLSQPSLLPAEHSTADPEQSDQPGTSAEDCGQDNEEEVCQFQVRLGMWCMTRSPPLPPWDQRGFT